VRFQKDPFPLNASGLALLRSEIDQHSPILVVIDPVIAYLDSELSFKRVRALFQKIFSLSISEMSRSRINLMARGLSEVRGGASTDVRQAEIISSPGAFGPGSPPAPG
jgi:hypothetical protein